jgi:UDP-glucuronate 4-epimerase
MHPLKDKTIIVTGSAGFVGFHLSKKLLEIGAHVVGVDNFNSYYDVTLKEKRNKILEEYPNFTLYRGDISDLEFISKVFDTHQYDYVCHLAAQAGVRYSIENPHVYVQSNLVGFVNILEQVRRKNISHFVYASSSSVYGSNTKIPFSVEDVTDSPVSLYAATKKSNELMAHVYNHLYKINTTGLRFFTVIGPCGRPDMAPMLFAEAILKGKPIQVFNNGKMQRDFTYVDDIVDGILKSLLTSDGNRVFNLGNHNPVQLEYFISCIEKEIGMTAIKEYKEMQMGDVVSTYADIEFTKQKLDWESKTSIEESVRLFVEWYKGFYKIQ